MIVCENKKCMEVGQSHGHFLPIANISTYGRVPRNYLAQPKRRQMAMALEASQRCKTLKINSNATENRDEITYYHIQQ